MTLRRRTACLALPGLCWTAARSQTGVSARDILIGQTLTELSGMHDLNAGDLVATGTPAGCAARAPGKVAMFIARHFLSDSTRWELFIRRNLGNPAYLKPQDVMELSIRTDDGQLDLGTQRTRVVAA